jgi:hypothetical protein
LGTVTQGELNGPCFANGTCNSGLSCDTVDGAATCTASSDKPPGDTTTGDASSTDPPIGDPDASSPPTSCSFQTTTYPCDDPMPPTACYGATQSCTLTGCGGSDIRWECNSARQCDETACCISAAVATLAAGASCAQGTLLMTAGASTGTVCESALACAAGETQLCQANSDCPKGQRCTPVKIAGAGASLNGTIVAVCVP